MGLFSIHIRFLFFGSYLDTSIDLSPELMEDILRGNKEVVHRSTYPPLTESQIQSQAHISINDAFNKNIHESLESYSTPDVIPDNNIEETHN